jgi:8-oxo-dGTP pyrophosphatase MutT (NUDIX family)
MKKVAKLVLVDGSNNCLLMYRSNHPTFGDDPDLPGGTLEEGELVSETMVREVQEEIGFSIAIDMAKEIYSGSDFSKNGTHYSLFIAQLNERPEITMSWEHSSYEWLSHEDFLEKARSANDTFMHMVHATLTKTQ